MCECVSALFPEDMRCDSAAVLIFTQMNLGARLIDQSLSIHLVRLPCHSSESEVQHFSQILMKYKGNIRASFPPHNKLQTEF